MVAKKLPPTSTVVLRVQLKRLRRRRRAVNNLIHALEMYARVSPSRRNKERLAA